MRRTYRLIALVLAAGTCSACGATLGARPGYPEAAAPEDPSVLAADLAKTRPLGPGPAYRPSAVANPNAQLGLPVGSLRCRSTSAAYGVHIELFARDRGVQVPAGIGIVQGRRRGPFVDRGRCRYELSTTDPTGVIAVRTGASFAAPTVGELFALWGQPLSGKRLGSFAGTVRAFLNGKRWVGDPRKIPLRHHAQIVLEVGPLVEPHPSYQFPPGL